MGVYADWADLYAPSFRDRMDDAKDIAFHRDRSRPLARVLDRPGPLIRWITVAEAAMLLAGPDDEPVSHARVKALVSQGRFGKCRRRPTGKGRAILIPTHWQSDGTYKLALERGRRGPKLRMLLSPGHEEVPF